MLGRFIKRYGQMSHLRVKHLVYLFPRLKFMTYLIVEHIRSAWRKQLIFK